MKPDLKENTMHDCICDTLEKANLEGWKATNGCQGQEVEEWPRTKEQHQEILGCWTYLVTRLWW